MKILMYSHDSYGLGHLRRTLALAESFARREPGTSVLILTGSMVSGAYRMSRNIDLIKLPSAVKVDHGVYEPSRMAVSFEALKRLRSRIIKSAAETFEPDVFLVDKAPLGMKSEVVATLEYLRREQPGALTVLGLRDVMDDPERVRRSWLTKGINKAIERLYDLILVYGPREVYDPIPLYGLSPEALARTHYVGYVGKEISSGEASGLPLPPGYALVTPGGGGDGFEVVRNYLEGLRLSEPDFDSLVVTGPLMEDEDRRSLERLAEGLRVELVDFRPDMEAIIAGARAVVAMGGYNTTTELLASRKPAIIVPRVEPRVEQLIRAEQLSRMGLVDMIHPNYLTPEVIRTKVEGAMRRGSHAGIYVDLSGAEHAVDLVYAALTNEPRPEPRLAAGA